MGTLCLPPLLGVFTLGRGGWEPPETETSKKKKGENGQKQPTSHLKGARSKAQGCGEPGEGFGEDLQELLPGQGGQDSAQALLVGLLSRGFVVFSAAPT